MPQKTFLFLTFFGLSVLFWGCSTPKNIVSLTAEEFAQHLAQEQVQLLDVRTYSEYNAEHIANAIHIDILSENFDSLATLYLTDKYPVFVYCRSGKRAAKAAEKLSGKNYTVYQLDGGITAWKQIYEVVK